jgi:hypothetical protein
LTDVGTGVNEISPASDFPDNFDALVTDKCSGGKQGTILEDSCYVIEIWCIDGSPASQQDGISCVYVDVNVDGDPNHKSICGESVEDTNNDGAAFYVSKNFPILQDGSLTDKSTLVDELGGCTTEAGLGVKGYVKLGTIEVVASQNSGLPKCAAELEAAQKDSSLFGGQEKKPVAWSEHGGIDWIHMCWGEIYDEDCDGQINAGDFSVFAPCWLEDAAGGCETADYNNDGVVNAEDFSYFVTAWQKIPCAGGITLPCSAQLHCFCSNESNAVVIYEDGSTEEVPAPVATREQIEAFGLQLPPEIVSTRVVHPRTEVKVKSSR